MAQPRHARDGPPGRESGGYGGNSYNEGQSPQTTQASTTQSPSNTPFDPQALAQLYTRMFQHFGGPMMGMNTGVGMGGMNPMMANMNNMGAGLGGGMAAVNPGMGRMGAAMGGMPGAMGPGALGGAMNGGGLNGGMGRGGPGAAAASGGPPTAPRGPRGAAQGPGPQRTQRGTGFHPYVRPS